LIDLGANENDNLAAGKYIANTPEHFITRTFDSIHRSVVLKPWPDGVVDV
jgi:hypothetical protein